MIVFMLRVSSEVIAAMDQGGPAGSVPRPAGKKSARQAAPLDTSIMRAVYQYAWKGMDQPDPPRKYAKTESSRAWAKLIEQNAMLDMLVDNATNKIIFEGVLTACMRVPSMLLCCTNEREHSTMLKVFLRNHDEYAEQVRYFSPVSNVNGRKDILDEAEIQNCVRYLLTSMVEDELDVVRRDQVRYGDVPAQNPDDTIEHEDAAQSALIELALHDDVPGDDPMRVNKLNARNKKDRVLPNFHNITDDARIVLSGDLSNDVLRYLKSRFNDRVAKILHCILDKTTAVLLPHIMPLIHPMMQKVICKISENMPTEHTPTHFDLTYYDSDEEVLCADFVFIACYAVKTNICVRVCVHRRTTNTILNPSHTVNRCKLIYVNMSLMQ
jgi:hypothetical protein